MSIVRVGSPLGVRPRSTESTAIYAPTDGLDVAHPPIHIAIGSTPASDNFIIRDGALEPRPTLSKFTASSSQPQGNVPVMGMVELQDTRNNRYPVWSGQTRHSAFGLSSNAGVWSNLSYTAANGVNDPPSVSPSGGAWDYTQIYSAEQDENLLYMANSSYQTLYVYRPDTTVFSTQTGAPQARFLASLDNYVVAFNVREQGNDLVQRVQWTDRGSASSWTGGLSGFQDLLDMRGAGTRVVTQDNALVLFSDEEIWRGTPTGGVFVWSFAPYDQNRGAPYSWTVAKTPLGLMFLGKDYQVYLLPKGGGLAQPIGQPLQREIRTTIDYPERAWATFDNTYGQYQLYYPVTGGTGFPQRAAYLDVLNGNWMPQSFDSAGGGIALTRGMEAVLSSSGTTWGGLQQSGITWGGLQAAGITWADLMGRQMGKGTLVGSSKGTIYYFNPSGTSDAGTAVPCKYRTPGLLADDPSEQKTVREFRLAYQSDSRSSLSVSYSQTVGASSVASAGLSLVTASVASQAIDYPYFGTRYPTVEVSSEGARYRLFQFFLTYTRGGR